jgi:sulfite reductase (NADPH) hemoprotein beta-component
MGPGFSEPELLLALDRLFEAYLALRLASDEVFSETVKRLGTSPFKSALYEVADAA